MTPATEPLTSRIAGKLFTKTTFSIFTVLVVIAVIGTFKQIATFLPADEFMVIQYLNGSIRAFTDSGYKWKLGGAVVHFKRSNQFWFSNKRDQGNSTDDSMKLRFFDGAHATISGGVRYDLPTSEACLIDLWRTYHTEEELENQLVRTVMEKTVYMTGPLMTSKQAYAEKRTQLLTYIEDQAAYGIYQTTTKTVQTVDPLTNEKKSVDITEVVKEGAKIARQEDSPLVRFGIKLYNLSINDISFDATVEAQIQEQQKAIMSVQTAIANSKKAEQDAQTAESMGKAAAAKAKWEQEVIKAKEVTKAEQEKAVAITNAEKEKAVAETLATQKMNVAEFANKAAEFTKLEQTALGEGEAARARAVMAANGALEQKLSAWKEVQIAYAQSLGQYRGAITPSIVMAGGAPGVGGTAAQSSGFTNFMDVIAIKAAKDLALDMSMKASGTP